MFPLLAGYYRYLELGEEVPELILVGISGGTDYFRECNQRSRDYTAEAPWDLEAEILPGESHFSAAPPACRRGIRWLFESDGSVIVPAPAQ